MKRLIVCVEFFAAGGNRCVAGESCNDHEQKGRFQGVWNNGDGVVLYEVSLIKCLEKKGRRKTVLAVFERAGSNVFYGR